MKNFLAQQFAKIEAESWQTQPPEAKYRVVIERLGRTFAQDFWASDAGESDMKKSPNAIDADKAKEIAGKGTGTRVWLVITQAKRLA